MQPPNATTHLEEATHISRTRTDVIQNMTGNTINNISPVYYVCNICCESQPLSSFRSVSLAPGCRGQCPQSCIECTKIWLREHMLEQPWHNLHCYNCRTRLPLDTVRYFSSSKIYDKYVFTQTSLRIQTYQLIVIENTWQHHISGLINFYWCGNGQCGSGQVHASAHRVMTCYKCGYDTCTACKTLDHPSMPCRYAQRNKGVEMDEDTRKMIHSTTHTCPSCGVTIEKSGGCDNMTCKKFPYGIQIIIHISYIYTLILK